MCGWRSFASLVFHQQSVGIRTLAVRYAQPLQMKRILPIAIIFFLFSCAARNELTLELSNADGLTTSSPVYSNGLIIGKVVKLKLNTSQSVVAIIELSDAEQKIPTDSRISIFNDDFFGNKAIEIELGKSRTNYNSTDTLEIDPVTKCLTITPDPISKAIGEGINMLTNQDKLDSILIELRRLNVNLEVHMKEHNKR